MSCLTWASGRGHTEIVRMLLDNGAKVNTADKVNISIFVMSYWASSRFMIKRRRSSYVALERWSYVVFTFQYGTTPLVWACRRGHKEIADMLLSEHATVDNAGMVGNLCQLVFYQWN